MLYLYFNYNECSFLSWVNVNKGGLQSVDVNVSPHDELLASQLLFVRVVADPSAGEPGVEGHTFLKESSQNKWLVLLGSIHISQFVYQLLDTGCGPVRRVELIVELTIFL